jgi:ABC-type lipoprotein export system ATPase subunit
MVDKRKVTLIVVTHDFRIIPFADNIDHLEDGEIIEKHPIEN